VIDGARFFNSSHALLVIQQTMSNHWRNNCGEIGWLSRQWEMWMSVEWSLCMQ